MPWHRSWAAVLAVVVALTLTAPAAAGVRTLAKRAPSPARADGEQTIAYMRTPGIVEVLDARGVPSFAVDVSASCVAPPSAVTAVGGGQVLFPCSVEHDYSFGRFPRAEPRLFDLATRTVHAPAGAAEALDYAEALPLGVGRFPDVGARGLRFEWGYYHGGLSVEAIDWWTGQRVREPSEPERVLDPDAPGLVTTLCEPLERRPWDIPFTGVVDPPPPFDPFLYEAPNALTWGPRSPLTFRRCGSRAARVLHPWPRRGARLRNVQLAAGFASWLVTDDPRDVERDEIPLHAYLPACDARVDWWVAIDTEAAHVRDALILSVPLEKHGPWRIRRIPLGRICERVTRAWTVALGRGERAVAVEARRATLRLRRQDAWATHLGARQRTVPELVVRPHAELGLRFGAPVRSVQWRTDHGPWRTATRHATWTVPATPGRLALDVRYRHGGAARFAARIADPR